MSFGEGLIVGAAALVILLGLADIAAWVLGRGRHQRTPHPSTQGRTEECEVCGAEISIVVAHLVTNAFDDDHVLAGRPTFGGTAMSAAYCTNHCPGGCRQGCAS